MSPHLLLPPFASHILPPLGSHPFVDKLSAKLSYSTDGRSARYVRLQRCIHLQQLTQAPPPPPALVGEEAT